MPRTRRLGGSSPGDEVGVRRCRRRGWGRLGEGGGGRRGKTERKKLAQSTVWASWQRWGAWTHRRSRRRNASPSASRPTASYPPRTWWDREESQPTRACPKAPSSGWEDLLPDVGDLGGGHLVALRLDHGEAAHRVQRAAVAQQVDGAPLLGKLGEGLPPEGKITLVCIFCTSCCLLTTSSKKQILYLYTKMNLKLN